MTTAQESLDWLMENARFGNEAREDAIDHFANLNNKITEAGDLHESKELQND